MYTSWIHGRDPGTLSNPLKGLKPSSQQKTKLTLGVESQLWEVTRKSTVNKGDVIIQISVQARYLRETLIRDFPYKCECHLQRASP